MPKNLKNLGDRLPRSQYMKETYETGRKLTVQYNVTPMPGSLEPKYLLKESGNGSTWDLSGDFDYHRQSIKLNSNKIQ